MDLITDEIPGIPDFLLQLVKDQSSAAAKVLGDPSVDELFKGYLTAASYLMQSGPGPYYNNHIRFHTLADQTIGLSYAAAQGPLFKKYYEWGIQSFYGSGAKRETEKVNMVHDVVNAVSKCKTRMAYNKIIHMSKTEGAKDFEDWISNFLKYAKVMKIKLKASLFGESCREVFDADFDLGECCCM